MAKEAIAASAVETGRKVRNGDGLSSPDGSRSPARAGDFVRLQYKHESGVVQNRKPVRKKKIPRRDGGEQSQAGISLDMSQGTDFYLFYEIFHFGWRADSAALSEKQAGRLNQGEKTGHSEFPLYEIRAHYWQ